MKKILHVEGMMCQNCARHVREALEAVSGVSGVEVQLEAKTASVTCADSVSDAALSGAVDEAGYEVKGIEAA